MRDITDTTAAAELFTDFSELLFEDPLFDEPTELILETLDSFAADVTAWGKGLAAAEVRAGTIDSDQLAFEIVLSGKGMNYQPIRTATGMKLYPGVGLNMVLLTLIRDPDLKWRLVLGSVAMMGENRPDVLVASDLLDCTDVEKALSGGLAADHPLRKSLVAFAQNRLFDVADLSEYDTSKVSAEESAADSDIASVGNDL